MEIESYYWQLNPVELIDFHINRKTADIAVLFSQVTIADCRNKVILKQKWRKSVQENRLQSPAMRRSLLW
jgi:hypothetical protein